MTSSHTDTTPGESVSTYHDWNPCNVDLLTIDQLAKHLGIPLELLGISAAMDPAFPSPRRCDDGLYRWRLSDAWEWYEGQRNGITKQTRLAGRAENWVELIG